MYTLFLSNREEAELFLKDPRPGKTTRPFLSKMKGKNKKRASSGSSEPSAKRKSSTDRSSKADLAKASTEVGLPLGESGAGAGTSNPNLAKFTIPKRREPFEPVFASMSEGIAFHNSFIAVLEC